MAGCNCGKAGVVVHIVTLPDGTEKKFSTESRANAYRDKHGGTVTQVVR